MTTDERKINFNHWFLESKVVNDKGEPMVVYHSTSDDFSHFKNHDVGFHFGSIFSAEKRFQDKLLNGAQNDSGMERQGGNIMPVYLSIQNPLRMQDSGDWNDANAVATFVGERMMLDDDFEARYMEALDANPEGDFRSLFLSMGYDGIVYNNEGEGGGDSFIAFQPEQIKSAIGNSGLFDGNNPDITDRKKECAARALNFLQSVDMQIASPRP